MQPGNPLSHTDPSGYISLHHSSDIDNPHAGFNNYDWRFNEMFQPGYGSGAGQWSHQYNSQWFNFGFLGPSAFDRLFGAGTFLNLLKAERISGGLSVNPSRFAFVLDALQAGFQFSVLEAFGKRTLVYSLGAIGNIIF